MPGVNQDLSAGSINCLQRFFSLGPTRQRVMRPERGRDLRGEAEEIATTLAKGRRKQTGSEERKVRRLSLEVI